MDQWTLCVCVCVCARVRACVRARAQSGLLTALLNKQQIKNIALYTYITTTDLQKMTIHTNLCGLIEAVYTTQLVC
jgi:hypothetical protein